MAYDYNNQLEAIQTLLRNNVTSTALGLSLTTDYPIHSDGIRIGDPKNLTSQIDQYPQVILSLREKEEEFAELGIGAVGIRRDITTYIDIYGFVFVGSDSRDSDKQAYTLARNIETVLRSNVKLATTTGWDVCLVERGIFEKAYVEPGHDDIYLSSIKLETKFEKKSIF